MKNKSIEKEFKQYRNLINKKIVTARNFYRLKQFIEKRNDIRGTWQLINEIIGKKNVNIDEFIIKNFENNLNNILNGFAINFNENVNKIIHKCNIKTSIFAVYTQQNSM